MGSNNVTRLGSLANNSLFFGDAQAEIISAANITRAGWNDGVSNNVTTSSPINRRGGSSDFGSEASALGFGTGAGSSNSYVSHRTILLGY
ncbi:hypothetical protein FWG76_00745 [Candidatus Saccharibacteria bacterium]|nr:hypothetical protein [Candidatus Saccharibacteria bacterium]